VVIKNRLGMHARPAMSFVDLASSFACDVFVHRADAGESERVDGKSIMQMMMLAATCGTELVITTEGPGAEVACRQLKELVERGFDEE